MRYPLHFNSHLAIGLLAILVVLQTTVLIVLAKPRPVPKPTPPRPVVVKQLDARLLGMEVHLRRE